MTKPHSGLAAEGLRDHPFGTLLFTDEETKALGC